MNFELTLSSLQDRGHRITKVRQEIVKIFSDYSVPLSANKVAKILSENGVSVNRATIYRELQFLLKKDYLTKVYLYSNEVSYESSDLRHHHHLVCEECGSVDNMTSCLASELEEDIYKKKGFKVKRHILEFYGICSKCAQR
jgi:Fe2+ or Zn2+ uptake regulation protein